MILHFHFALHAVTELVVSVAYHDTNFVIALCYIYIYIYILIDFFACCLSVMYVFKNMILKFQLHPNRYQPLVRKSYPF